MNASTAVILAAGKGTRMRSDTAKVLHALGGRPLVMYPIAAATDAGVDHVIVVTGHAGQEVRAAVAASLTDDNVQLSFVHQAEQLGTGHALACALEALADRHGPVLVLSGDVPLVRSQTLRELRREAARSPVGLAFATFEPTDRTGYGRVVRDPLGRVVAIVEERDCTDDQRQLVECNAGTYCIDADVLRQVLPDLGRGNAQGEMYLTDVVAVLAARGEVRTLAIDAIEAAGVNTFAQLAALEAELASRGS